MNAEIVVPILDVLEFSLSTFVVYAGSGMCIRTKFTPHVIAAAILWLWLLSLRNAERLPLTPAYQRYDDI